MVNVTNDGEFVKRVIHVGKSEDKPEFGNIVKVHYVAKLCDGRVVYSSPKHCPFEFQLGFGQVIKGFDVVVASMTKGETCEFTLPEKYDYGKRYTNLRCPLKFPTTYPSAKMLFEVTLIDFTLEDLSPRKNGGVLRRILVQGKGYHYPRTGCTVIAHVVGRFGDNEFFDAEVTYTLCEESAKYNVPVGIDIALTKFKVGEKSRIFLTPPFGFGSEGNSLLGVAPNAEVVYDIELKGFEKVDYSSFLKGETIAQAEILNAKGTKNLKEGEVQGALVCYKKVADILRNEEFKGDNEVDQQKQRNRLHLAACLNSALCCLKLSDWESAVQQCNIALDFDQNCVKGLFRRGLAFIGKHESGKAIADFERVLAIEPDNKAAAHKIVELRHLIKKDEQKEKHFCREIFSKFSEENKHV